jgi:hypothetical protein
LPPLLALSIAFDPKARAVAVAQFGFGGGGGAVTLMESGEGRFDPPSPPTTMYTTGPLVRLMSMLDELPHESSLHASWLAVA